MALVVVSRPTKVNYAHLCVLGPLPLSDLVLFCWLLLTREVCTPSVALALFTAENLFFLQDVLQKLLINACLTYRWYLLRVGNNIASVVAQQNILWL